MQKKYADGKTINNSLQTNGVSLYDEWCNFFKENNFLIGLSIDGPEEMHDHYRVYKGNQPTFKKVMHGLELLKKHNVEFNTLTCVNRINSSHPLTGYKFLKEIGSIFLQFIPIVERKAEETEQTKLELVSPDFSGQAQVTDWSVEAEQYGKFLISIFDEWVHKDVGKIFIQMFEVSLESWYGKPQSLCVFRETCGTAMAIEHNGDLYSCDHYVYPENLLGNILPNSMALLVDSDKEVQFGLNKKDKLLNYCKDCEVKFACNGECQKHRFIKTPDGEEGLNYLCESYKHFFNHINVYMKYMVKEILNKRSAANVIQWTIEKDSGFRNLQPCRNELCPCGSGKKYKNCCIK